MTQTARQKKNAPTLRFPKFDGEWKPTKLGALIETINGLTYSPADIRKEGLLVLRSSNVQQGRVAFDDNVFVGLGVENDKLTQEGDILLCVRNGSKRLIGKSAKIPAGLPKATHGAFMSILRGDQNNFVFQLLQTQLYYREVHKNLGATINSINGANLKKFTFQLPNSPAEQHKIASFLSAIDKKIEMLEQKKNLLDQYKKGMMQKLFSQELRFKDKDGNDFPDWEEKRLGDLCKITTGKLDANAMVEEGQYHFFTCAREAYRIDNYAFDTDALLISGNGANVGYIHHFDGKFNAYQRTYVLDGFSEEISYVQRFLEHSLKRRIYSEVKDGNTPYIVKGTLTGMKIGLPKMGEQQKIANFLSDIDKKIGIITSKFEQARAFKKGLLQQMFV